MPFVESIRARNILSFGDPGLDLELRDLNVIIGANSSGKSNLVSLFSLLQAAPDDITRPIAGIGGGIREWLWKGSETAVGEIDVTLRNPESAIPLRYAISFREEGQRFWIVDERLENQRVEQPHQSDVRFYFRYERGHPWFSVIVPEEEADDRPTPGRPGAALASRTRKRVLQKEELKANQSVLAQRRGSEQYPEITRVAEAFSRIRIYQDWQFSRTSAARLPQGTDLPNDFLLEDASNLALIVDDVKFGGGAAELREYLQLANPEFETVHTRTLGGTIQLFIEETGLKSPTPANRLSQGALQLLCLLVVLLHPRPPKLVCLEEPEKGLHPDILPELAKLLVKASERMQLIVTTHSEILVDALTDRPESVVVCERAKSGTTMKRLSSSELGEWLEQYRSLGQLWRQGNLGGNRW